MIEKERETEGEERKRRMKERKLEEEVSECLSMASKKGATWHIQSIHSGHDKNMCQLFQSTQSDCQDDLQFG